MEKNKNITVLRHDKRNNYIEYVDDAEKNPKYNYSTYSMDVDGTTHEVYYTNKRDPVKTKTVPLTKHYYMSDGPDELYSIGWDEVATMYQKILKDMGKDSNIIILSRDKRMYNVRYVDTTEKNPKYNHSYLRINDEYTYHCEYHKGVRKPVNVKKVRHSSNK